MPTHRNDHRSFWRDRTGSINIMAAVSTTIVVGVLALGVDYGRLSLQRRTLQSTSDLAAIVAAANIQKAEEAAIDHFALNGMRLVALRSGRLITERGEVPIERFRSLKNVDGYAEIIRGRYTPDISIAPAKRFVAGATPHNAVMINAKTLGDLTFAGSISPRPDIFVRSIASANEQAAFSIGSRLASLNGGIINKTLGALLGANISLNAMDYGALLEADVNVFAFSQSLATRLHMEAGTYDQLLNSEIKLGDLFNALGGTRGLSPPVAAVINDIGRSLGSSRTTVRLDKILNLDPYRSLHIDRTQSFAADVSAFDLINAIASAANAGKQLSVDLGATVPGLASAKLDLAIGEPPVGTPFLAVGQEGSIVRTAQTRAKITVTANGLAALAGIKITIPLYVEVAHAEAALSEINCLGGGAAQATVKIDAVPGVAEIALGSVDMAAFNHFESDPRVTKATLVDSPLLKVAALAHVYADNMKPKTVIFSATDVAEGRIQSISTQDVSTSLMNSLLHSLDVEIRVLVLTIGTPKAIQQALADTLSAVTAPLDSVVYNTLLALGIRIGEADIQVTGVSCQRPVLVQ